mgnify:CR=1 FL=1
MSARQPPVVSRGEGAVPRGAPPSAPVVIRAAARQVRLWIVTSTRAAPGGLGTGARIAVAVAALALLAVLVLPLWRIDLEAPQYPEGLGMEIRVNTIVGVKPNDLNNINNLNHYIGMKVIRPEDFPELRFMPLLVAGLSGMGLVVAATGRRRLLYVWVALLVLCAVAGLADFYRWSYDYGHNLDHERAIIKVPGMTYQPPLIGSKQLLNFRAHSWPGSGGWIAIAAGALASLVAARELVRARRARRLAEAA